MSHSQTNRFLTGPLGPTYARTALPIILVMSMNGLLTVADALFLGHYVGADALAAVTLVFPIYMLMIALATLVSSGMSSALARRLGARRFDDARVVFATAHGLSLICGAALIAVFAAFGDAATLALADGDRALAQMGKTYLHITVAMSPLMFILSVQSDALRNEGRVGLMAGMSVLISLLNVVCNYVLIAVLDMGVAGSALGTAMAQGFALITLVVFRVIGQTRLRLPAPGTMAALRGGREILALGAPQSLSFLGIALGSMAIIAALQWTGTPQYEETVSAYGIITRVLTFTFLPLLGLSHAMQTITGNTFGAGMFGRVDHSLRIAVVTAGVYCAVTQAVLMTAAGTIGAAFTSDAQVIAEVARILPQIVLLFFISGPLMMISSHFQSIGDARRAAILGLSKTYLFSLPLTAVMTMQLGEPGIWLASPASEALLLGLTVLVLASRARGGPYRWGLFHSSTAQVMS